MTAFADKLSASELAYLALLEDAAAELRECDEREGEAAVLATNERTRLPGHRRRPLGCPGCGQARGLEESAARCVACGWNVAGNVRRWSDEGQERFAATVVSLLGEGEERPERAAFEALREVFDGV